MHNSCPSGFNSRSTTVEVGRSSLVAVIPGKALLPFQLQGQCCIASGVAVRILEVVASPVRILETTNTVHFLTTTFAWRRSAATMNVIKQLAPEVVYWNVNSHVSRRICPTENQANCRQSVTIRTKIS